MGRFEGKMANEILFAFTIFETAYHATGTFIEEVSWNPLIEKLADDGVHFPEPVEGEKPSETKLRCPQIVPGKFADMSEGATKSKDNFVEAYLGVLDFDDVSDDVLEQVRRVIKEKKLAAVIYSTYSHAKARKKGLNRFRVMFPFDRPVPKNEWPLIWPGMYRFFGCEADTSCSDPGHGYQLPSAPKGTSPEDIIFEAWRMGNPMRVDHLYLLLDDVQLSPEKIKGEGKPIKEKTLRRFARKLQRRNVETGESIEKMLDGEPFAESGNRDNTIYQMCQDIGKEFPNSDAATIAEWFGPSLSNMPGEEEITVEEVQKKIERAQGEKLAGAFEKGRSNAAAWQTVKKRTGADIYTREGMQAYLDETKGGTTLDAMRKRLVVLHRSDYYVFFDYDYKNYSRDGVFPAFNELVVTPASGVWNGVRAHKVDSGGNDVPMSGNELLNEYGTSAVDAEIRLGQRLSYFDEGERKLVLGRCAVRPTLRPRYSEEVNTWMVKLCKTEQQLENLRDYMAMVPNLSYRLAMLVLIGKKGIGKTPFCTGLARIWHTSYVDMGTLFESFHEELARCAYLVADEEFPRDSRGHTPSAKIRSTISRKEHMLNRKGVAKIKATGYLRLAATVNNYQKIEALSYRNRTEDTAALLARMLIIDCQEEAAEHFDGEKFVEGDAIAEHALWLQKERGEQIIMEAPPYGIRNLHVARESTPKLLDTVAEEVLECVSRYLDERLGEDEWQPPAFVAKRRVFVHIRTLYESWEKFFGLKARIPKFFDVRDAIKDLSDLEIRLRTPTGKTLRYRAIRDDILQSYMSDQDISVEEQLAIYTEQIVSEDSYFKLPSEYYPRPEDRADRALAIANIEQKMQESAE